MLSTSYPQVVQGVDKVYITDVWVLSVRAELLVQNVQIECLRKVLSRQDFAFLYLNKETKMRYKVENESR